MHDHPETLWQNQEDRGNIATMTTAPDTRSRIVTTAEHLFRVYGYQKTTVADIAKELKMSPANIYRFFQSKMELTEAVGRLLMGEVEAAATTIATNAEESASSRMRRFLAAVCRMNAERYVDDNKMHEMCAVAMNENWPLIKEHVGRLSGLIEKIIADGMAAGEFRAGDAKLLAKCVHKATVILCHPMLIAEHGSAETEALLPVLTEFVVAALRNGVEGVAA